MILFETDRLLIRHFTLDDTDYVLSQLNEKPFIDFIADRGVRTRLDAKNYLQNAPIASYQSNGFGLNMVMLKDTQIPIGMCGLVKRPELASPDLGFAFLERYWGKGYAKEASKTVMFDALNVHKLNAILGVTKPENIASQRLLQTLGFVHVDNIELYDCINHLYQYQG
ncbi:GNAT family N-acetyltransferase [Glaciecola sp. XM2]|uniref:GNAT family N-acetyltransferase n=1 Tax=Glaciecola sp. XM2 TaxID=1914931 RepID=UPI001BDF6BFB|nr:GNAT family N-acetyltransferase [Glaciecola sp. XM2]